MTGREEADRVVASSLARALRDLRDAVPLVADASQATRLRDLCELLAFLTGRDAPAPRDSGLDLHVLLRHAVSSLRRDLLVETMGAGAARTVMTGEGPIVVLEGEDPAGVSLAKAHDAIDTVVSVLGGVPELIEDPDDWLTDADEPPELVSVEGAQETAGTAALLARDGLGLLRESRRPEAAMLMREAAGLVAASLALRCALSVPDGAPRGASSRVAERGVRAFERFEGSLESWSLLGGTFPQTLLDGLKDVGAFAREVFTEVEIPARAPGMP